MACRYTDTWDWSEEEVYQHLEYLAINWQVNTRFLHNFKHINGRQLHQMSEADFIRLDPENGRLFYENVKSRISQNNNSIYNVRGTPMSPTGYASQPYSGLQTSSHTMGDTSTAFREAFRCMQPGVEDYRNDGLWKDEFFMNSIPSNIDKIAEGDPILKLEDFPLDEEINKLNMDCYPNQIYYSSPEGSPQHSPLGTEEGLQFPSPSHPSYGIWGAAPPVTPDYPQHIHGEWNHHIESGEHLNYPVEYPTTQEQQKNARPREKGPKVVEFLKNLLNDPDTNPSIIRWENEQELMFRLVEPEEAARRWGERRPNQKKPLSYPHFSRAMRYYYRTGRLISVPEKKLVWKFGQQTYNAK